MAMKPQKPTLEDVHQKVRASLSAQVFRPAESKEKDAYAIDAIKAYGIDDFFCVYDRYLCGIAQPVNMGGPYPDWQQFYIHAAKLYHGSKQHWRRRT
jgi:hypothetical protein